MSSSTTDTTEMNVHISTYDIACWICFVIHPNHVWLCAATEAHKYIMLYKVQQAIAANNGKHSETSTTLLIYECIYIHCCMYCLFSVCVQSLYICTDTHTAKQFVHSYCHLKLAAVARY
jgi:hypothetical protein